MHPGYYDVNPVLEVPNRFDTRPVKYFVDFAPFTPAPPPTQAMSAGSWVRDNYENLLWYGAGGLLAIVGGIYLFRRSTGAGLDKNSLLVGGGLLAVGLGVVAWRVYQSSKDEPADRPETNPALDPRLAVTECKNQYGFVGAGIVTIRVTRPDGRPWAGAEVWKKGKVVGDPCSRAPARGDFKYAGVTDENGDFRTTQITCGWYMAHDPSKGTNAGWSNMALCNH